MSKYNSLEELRKKKALLKKDVEEMQDLLTFENKKESLSALTNGFTDRFLEERTDASGDEHLTVKTGEIAKSIGQMVTAKSEEKSVLHFNNEGLQKNVLDNALRVGTVALASGMAKKNLRKPGWKSKLLGLAMVYFLPIALKFISKKLSEFQQKKSISSMEKLI